MRHQIKAALLAATMLVSVPAAVQAQEAIFAVTAREVGAPTYNPITATKLNSANSLIFDRLLLQDADQSFHGLLASS